MGLSTQQQPTERERLLDRYYAVRDDSVRLCEPLELEDYVIQSMPDVSPPKWHLAHTSWFFETFILAAYDKVFQPYNPQYDYLFNSYYITHGKPFLRSQRGLLSRPTIDEIMQYRAWVDEAIASFIIGANESDWQEISDRITLGLHHEQHHQELLLTDIKHILSFNPLKPAYRQAMPASSQNVQPLSWQEYKGGLISVGHQTDGFAYDNEGPDHRVYVNPFKLASRLITNGEYLEFMNDGGYLRPEFWLSEGWAHCNNDLNNKGNWQAPLYWELQGNEWWHFTLEGMQRVQLGAPVCHVSLYEANAYARWANKRLPTEFEWEHVANSEKIAGNLREQNHLKPVADKCNDCESGKIRQLYGDVWEWTASAYGAYPGYKPASGAIGEYNGKFMSGQNVLRGGSFATPQDHIRSTYRNFFYPKDRWQFSGIRLAGNYNE